MNKLSWILWAMLTVGLGGYFGYTLLASDDKSEFLIGATSYGHYQIEMACSSCHQEAFGGPDLIQEACINCHGAELKEAHDSHPRKKFTDPRNADRLAVIDARYCVSCHTEHKPDQTHPMGVTLATDYCYHCHIDIGDDRESHKDLPFDSCASAGCHNFHDNRALYESFLVANANQPWLKETPRITTASAAHRLAEAGVAPHPDTDLLRMQQQPEISEQWQHSAHARAEVSCTGCHTVAGSDRWIEKPGLDQCRSCHENEARGFVSGKHGMRLADDIETPVAPISPAESPLAFKSTALNVQHGCNACHQSHIFDTQFAAVKACVQCHDDLHSRNFASSKHGELWRQASNGLIPKENAVTCATCHLPRLAVNKSGTEVVKQNSSDEAESDTGGDKPIMRVEHNQNRFLRPNEKMIRPVCMQCHSLEFSIDALADPKLINNNFNGKPGAHIPSIDWALKREVERAPTARQNDG